MGRKPIVVLLMLGLLLVACSGEEGAPVAEAASPLAVDLGPAGPEAGLATIAVDDQGRAMALLEREDGSDEGLLVRCLDRGCSERVTSAVPGVTGIVDFTTEGHPILLMDEGLLRCADVACSSFSVGAVPGEVPLGMTLGADGNPIVAGADWIEGVGYRFGLYLCRDSMCAQSDHVVVASGIAGFDHPGRLELLPGGEPVLFYRSDRGEVALVCGSGDCATVERHELASAEPASGEPLPTGLPSRAVATRRPAPRFWLATCVDQRCSRFTRTEVGRVFGGLFAGGLAVATGFVAAGGVPVVVVAGEVEDGFQAALIACGDPACDGFGLTRLGPIAGLQVAATTIPEGPLVITFNRGGHKWLLVCENPLAC